MSNYHLAQLNVATSNYAMDDPIMKDFVNNLDRINQLADQSPGFVWRLINDVRQSDNIKFFGENVIVNMSVWENTESLHDYVYRTAHAKIMSRRKEWFERMQSAYMVLWWIPKHTVPNIYQAKKKLHLLQTQGPTEQAFTFKTAFPPPDSCNNASTREYDDLCPAN